MVWKVTDISLPSFFFCVPLPDRNCEILQASISYLSVYSASRLYKSQRDAETGFLLSSLLAYFPPKNPSFHLGDFMSRLWFSKQQILICLYFTPPSAQPTLLSTEYKTSVSDITARMCQTFCLSGFYYFDFWCLGIICKHLSI